MGDSKKSRPQFTLMALLASFVFVWSSFALVGVRWFIFLLAIFLLIGIQISFKQKITLVKVLCNIAIIGILMAIIFPIQSHAISYPQFSKCAAKLEAITKAIAAYHNDYGCFPPACIRDDAGRPMHSWRVLILPYLGHDKLYASYRFDEPWNGPNNSKLLKARPMEYLCGEWGWRNWKKGETTCVAVTGTKTMWPDDRSVRRKDIRDGADQTILIGEISPTVGIQWLEPRDATSTDVTLGIDEFDWSNTVPPRGLAAVHRINTEYNTLVAMADGSVRGLTKETKPKVLDALLTPAGGESVDLDSVASKRLNPSKILTITGKIIAVVLLVVSLTIMIVSMLRHRRALAAEQEANADQPSLDAVEISDDTNPSGTA